MLGLASFTLAHLAERQVPERDQSATHSVVQTTAPAQLPAWTGTPGVLDEPQTGLKGILLFRDGIVVEAGIAVVTRRPVIPGTRQADGS